MLRLRSIFGLVFSSLLAAQVQAGDRCSKAEADIEDICGRVVAEESGFSLSVKYEVEIEDARPGEEFDLVMSLRENGRRVVDESGQPIEFAAHLIYPDDCRDEIVFKDRIETQLGKCSISCPRDLEICAKVVSGESSKVLDRDDEDLTFIDNRPPSIVQQEVYYEPAPPPIVRREVYRERVYCPSPVVDVEVYTPPWVNFGFHYSHGGRRHCR